MIVLGCCHPNRLYDGFAAFKVGRQREILRVRDAEGQFHDNMIDLAGQIGPDFDNVLRIEREMINQVDSELRGAVFCGPGDQEAEVSAVKWLGNLLREGYVDVIQAV